MSNSIFHCVDHLTELDCKRLFCSYIIAHASQTPKTVLFVRDLDLLLFYLDLEVPDVLLVLCYPSVEPFHQLIAFECFGLLRLHFNNYKIRDHLKFIVE